MNRVKVKQRDLSDCGPSCIVSIGAYYKMPLSVAQVKLKAGTDLRGTTLLGMMKALEKVGFKTKAVRGNIEDLSQIPIPAIAHVVKEGLHHFVVIYLVNKKYVKVMDPAEGKLIKHTINEFKKIWTNVLLLPSPAPNFLDKKSEYAKNPRFTALVRPFRSDIALIIIGSLIYTVLGLSTAVYIQKILDNVLPNFNTNLLNLLSISLLVILAFQFILNILRTKILYSIGKRIDVHLILTYFEKVIDLPLLFFNSMRTGDIISRINDSFKIRMFITDTAVGIVMNLSIVFFSVLLMFSYYWKLALISIIVIPIFLVLYLLINRVNRKLEKSIMNKAADYESFLVEQLANIRSIKIFRIEQKAKLKSEVHFVSFINEIYKSNFRNLVFSDTGQFLSRVLIVVVLWTGSLSVLNAVISVGELMSFYAIIAFFIGPINSILSSNKSFQEAMVASDRLFEILELEEENKSNAIEGVFSFEKGLFIKNLFFRHSNRKLILEDVSVNIPKGKFVSIVGESGSGKSTIASLLMSEFKEFEGGIYFDKISIDQISSNELTKSVTLVTQDTQLFEATMLENIALGDYEPNVPKIKELIEQIDPEFLDSFEGGLAFELNSRTNNLSGGQKQKISLMRSLYLNPKLLILDEATSSLDSISENRILRYLKELNRQGLTVIHITHRLRTVIDSDKIYVMKGGKVVESGTHEDLIAKSGDYYSSLNMSSSL